ncbi:hypothetical protein [Hungatella hathewayi]|uniref:hypothetical protein n=1 Tax=Hungatella hathewayi TaxID=154046 RepID=UPI00356721FE
MKLNMKKTVGAGALALALAVSAGTMAFAANAQSMEGQNPHVIAEVETVPAYRTAADCENDPRMEKDVSAVSADSGVKYVPEGDNLVRDDAALDQNRK